MVAKYRSKNDYAQIYNGDKKGFNLGLDGAIYIRKETVQRQFQAPRIGTSGSSVSAASPSTDISGGTNNKLLVNLRGRGNVAVNLGTTTSLTSGPLIAAALESAINTALVAAGRDDRVWVEFASSLYKIHDQSTGAASTLVVSPGASDDVTVALKLGTANSGVETAGTDDQDYLLYTSGGPKFNQDIESNQHRSGRYHAGIVRKKKVAEFDLETYINMGGSAGSSIDTAVRLLWENLLGTETVNGGSDITYTQGLPNFTFSLVRVSTIFGEYYTGGYVKGNDLKIPGNGPGTCKWTGKCAQASIAGLAKVLSPVTSSTTVPVNTKEASNYSDPQHDASGTVVVSAPVVMIIDTDGRTILAGADGSLTVVAIDRATDELTLSSAVSVPAQGFVVPWDPGAVQKTGRDNIFTDLHGSFFFEQEGDEVDVTEIGLSIQNNHSDLDDRFGKDSNAGYVAGGRCDMKLSVKFDLNTAETLGPVIQARLFNGLSPMINVGDASTGRKLVITAPRWIASVPTIDVPQSGPTPTTLEGMLYQSAAGAQDPIKVKFA